MASYQFGFDPPPRPDSNFKSRRLEADIPPQSGSFSRRLATYTHQSSSSPLRIPTNGRSQREVDVSHISGRTREQQGPPDVHNRRTNIPKPVSGDPPINPLSKSHGPSLVGRHRLSSSGNIVSGSLAPAGSGFRLPSAQSKQVTESLSLQDDRPRNVLRRKPSSIAQHSLESDPRRDDISSSASSPWPSLSLSDFANDETLYRPNQERDDLIRSNTPPAPEVQPAVIPEFDRYRPVGDRNKTSGNRYDSEIPHKLTTQDLPPPTPLSSGLSIHSHFSMHSGTSGYSASPSTRYSESPGPGAYSRDTTPTSISSQSPGIIAPLRLTPRLRQTSPIKTRPPVTRRRMGSATDEQVSESVDAQGLPSLRESLTSSSSNSTVKGAEKSDKKTKEKKKKKRLSPLPPSPPPRKSSQKFKNTPSREELSPSKTSKSPAKSVMTTSTEDQSPVKIRDPGPQSSGSAPPRRPSRDGTPDLHSPMDEPPTIVQSNLVSIPFSVNRRLSGIAAPKIAAQNSVPSHTNSRLNYQSRLPPRSIHATNLAQPPIREATPAPAGLGIIPDLRPPEIDQREPRDTLRTPSPSVTTPKSRFVLFGRRTKATPELPTTEPKEKPSRKGPAAGTGHEGYSRYGLKSRAGAVVVPRDRGRSNASSSQESSRINDPFLADRISPVVIAGGGEIVENHNTSLDLARTESSQSATLPRPSLESKFSQVSSKSNLSKEVSRTTLWPSSLPRMPVSNQSSTSIGSKSSVPSESSDNEHFNFKPSLAFRRSMHRLKSSDIATLTLPKPISVYPAAGSSAASSQDASFTSDDTRYEITRPASAPKAQTTPKKLSKRPRSPRKWNFFQRSHDTASPKPKPQPKEVLPVVVELAPEKSVAYYAMIDSSEPDGDEPMNIEDILRDADVDLLIADPAPTQNSVDNFPPLATRSHVPPPEAVSSKVTTITMSNPPEPSSWLKNSPISTPDNLAIETTPRRPSRLAQVGRIPKVVPARPQQTSPKSFSRPFARISITQLSPNLTTVDRQSIAVGPSPERSPERPNPVELASPEEEDEEDSPARPFLVISPRKNSEATTSSSSGVLSFAGITAVIPEPDAELEEDEVWDEYDDLIGNDETMKLPPSASSSNGGPFQYERFESRKAMAEETPSVEDIIEEVQDGDKPRPLQLLSQPRSPDFATKIRDGLSTLTPTTPMSFADFFSGYGDRNNSVVDSSGGTRHMSGVVPQRDSLPLSTHSKPASVRENSQISGDSKLITMAESHQESPAAQVNLRVGSMTVSKWLTFGHVLFSPAREEILASEETSKHYSVLVIDGLGNDDWSFYAAETYPMATFYNISPSPSRNSNSHRPSAISFPQTPVNHRQVQYLSTLDKFPFPRETFIVVVLRFPPSCSDPVFRNLISESKRVLKPSGYLEMSILDLDMMNMGNRTRRAVRSLKVQISIATPTISLAPASDTVLRTLGKRGFTDIKSCRVGVPVASTVNSNVASSSDQARNEMEISLADMMRDDSSEADEGITKMVAKVGRWWFTRCYEMSVMPQGDLSRSIFADEALLGECERWRTSFKLLVCHAQKPVVARRRTASV